MNVKTVAKSAEHATVESRLRRNVVVVVVVAPTTVSPDLTITVYKIYTRATILLLQQQQQQQVLAAVALLSVVRGLRSTSRGGHALAVYANNDNDRFFFQFYVNTCFFFYNYLTVRAAKTTRQ